MSFEPDLTPRTKEEIVRYSYQYQREWRFEREKRLMQHALALFPNWDYVHKRLEWHTRPVFHRDPSKSKTQPRKPLNLTRDPQYTPSQETIDKMCFVTGADSNQPYFDLCVQLIESIKSTELYKNVDIKVLDCGLNEEDKAYLINRFGVEVKDPGWDVNPDAVAWGFVKWWSRNGWKGIISRPYIHKHFPGYKYYFWADADFWFQHEGMIDSFLHLCVENGLAATPEGSMIWDKQGYSVPKYFIDAMPIDYVNSLLNQRVLHGGVYCISLERSIQYEQYCDQAILEHKVYRFGFDMSMLSYFFYNVVKGRSFYHNFPNYFELHALSKTDENRNILTNTGALMGGICLAGLLKHFPYRLFFPRNGTLENEARKLDKIQKSLAEETAYELCKKDNLTEGNYFYRIYPNPEDEYGPMEGVL